MWVAPRPGLEPGTRGLTPISRRGVKTANESLVALATILSRSLPLYRPARTRFFVVLAANRIAPNTHQVQALCRPRTRPGGPRHPRRTLVPRRVQECCLQFSGCQPLGTSLGLARDACDPDSIN